MAVLNHRKVAVIGCGFVGAASAFALMESGSIYNEVCYCDNLEPYILVIMANQPTTQIEKEFVGK